MTDTRKVYVTRYALTKGIIKRDGDVFAGEYFDREDLAYTITEALEQCEAKRRERIEQLKAQIERLESLSDDDFMRWGFDD